MHDSKKQGKHWNITFFDYAAQSIQGDQLANYGMHFLYFNCLFSVSVKLHFLYDCLF